MRRMIRVMVLAALLLAALPAGALAAGGGTGTAALQAGPAAWPAWPRPATGSATP